MVATLDRLRQDHVAMAKLLDALERQVDAFGRGVAPDYDIMEGVLHYCRRYPDLAHHPTEDRVFEALRRRDAAAADALGDLPAEHEALMKLTESFAEAVRAVLLEAEMPRAQFETAARAFLDTYRRHMADEEENFFPVASRLLPAAAWSQIEAEISGAPDPLSGPRVMDEFRALHHDILAWDTTESKGS